MIMTKRIKPSISHIGVPCLCYLGVQSIVAPNELIAGGKLQAGAGIGLFHKHCAPVLRGGKAYIGMYPILQNIHNNTNSSQLEDEHPVIINPKECIHGSMYPGFRVICIDSVEINPNPSLTMMG